MRVCEVTSCTSTATTRVRLPGGGAPELRDVCELHRGQVLAGLGEAPAWSPSAWSCFDCNLSHRRTLRGEAMVVEVGGVYWPLVRLHRDRSPGFLVLAAQRSLRAARRAATLEIQ